MEHDDHGHDLADEPQSASWLEIPFWSSTIFFMIFGIAVLCLSIIRRRYQPLKAYLKWMIILTVALEFGFVMIMLSTVVGDDQCVWHSSLFHSALPIIGTFYVVRATWLFFRFEQTAEQVRWLQLLQKDEKNHSSGALIMAEGDEPSAMLHWIQFLERPPIAISASALLLLLLWVPPVVFENLKAVPCGHDGLNFMELTVSGILCIIVGVLGFKMKGRFDGYGLKIELKVVAVVTFIVQVLNQLTSQVFMDSAHAHEEEASDHPKPTSLYISHGIASLRFMCFIIISLLVPLIRSFKKHASQRQSFIIDIEKMTLIQLFQIPQGKSLFQEFLESIFCVENFIFYEEVRQFEEQCKKFGISDNFTESLSAEDAKFFCSEIVMIYKKFIIDSSMMQVNLPFQLSNTMNKIGLAAEELLSSKGKGADLGFIQESRAALLTAQTSIYELMRTDSYPRFVDKHADAIRDMLQTNQSVLVGLSKNSSQTKAISSLAGQVRSNSTPSEGRKTKYVMTTK